MRLLQQPSLKSFTTLRTGGPARQMLIPEDRNELIEGVIGCHYSGMPYAVIGKGSNLFVDDHGFNGIIINNTRACTELYLDNGLIVCGSSVRLQLFVKFCVENARMGSEYLYSVPGNMGGALVMNAGRGKAFKQSVADFLVHVEILDGDTVRHLSKRECNFAYRTSIFQKKRRWVILSAAFNPPFQSTSEGEQKIAERMQLVKQFHDNRFHNAGSVFKSHFRDLPEIRGYRYGNACFSDRTSNWICNLGGATSADINQLIQFARTCHLKRGLLPPQLEWRLLNDYEKVPVPLLSRLRRPLSRSKSVLKRFLKT